MSSLFTKYVVYCPIVVKCYPLFFRIILLMDDDKLYRLLEVQNHEALLNASKDPKVHYFAALLLSDVCREEGITQSLKAAIVSIGGLENDFTAVCSLRLM